MRAMPANVWLLTLIQALVMCVGTMMVLSGGVLGAQLAPDPKWATLPLAMMIVGVATGVLPLTRLMQHFGRKPVFSALALSSCVACIFAAWSITQQNFSAFTLSGFMLGISTAGFQQIRFAAMESVSPELMPKAASTVLLGGLLAAFIGPELVMLGNRLVTTEFIGGFYLMAGILVLACLLFTATNNTHVAINKQDGTGRPLRIIIKQPVFILAVSASVVGYALMSFIMTATPVHMHVIEHHSLQHTKWVIQSHIFAMFFPSLFSGWLMTKIGVNRVIMLGIAAYILTIVAGLSGGHLLNYWVALVLLGIGWNFLFVGGTVLLAKSYLTAEKFKVQGLNEFMVFGCQALASLSAGLLLNLLGWQGLLVFSLAIVALLVVVVGIQGSKGLFSLKRGVS
ncbi:ABC transporter permease [Paraglaciecola hydrolytica]|uniref:ABC transporter permease n=2 Tax=Paraglaciecola hydrolytica TaxID=1799789 RepID=A0A136A511_9ALTE|nr:ABC transporter permease [Paraglaciecola hydrolytica]